MAKKTAPLLPATEALLEGLGERLRLVRLRRRLPARQVAERAGMAPMTLRNVERGGAGVTIGAYVAVMQVLGVERDLELIGQSDTMGRSLQDAQLPGPGRKHRRKENKTAQIRPRVANASHMPSQVLAKKKEMGTRRKGRSGADSDWPVGDGFTTSQDLLDLIDLPPGQPEKKRR